MKGLLLDYKCHWKNRINIHGNTENPRSSRQDPFVVLWRLVWCSGAGCTALGRFFHVGRSCSVPDFTGFPRVVQCAGQAICVEMLASQKRTLRGCVWMLSFFLLAGAGCLCREGCCVLLLRVVCGGCGGARGQAVSLLPGEEKEIFRKL